MCDLASKLAQALLNDSKSDKRSRSPTSGRKLVDKSKKYVTMERLCIPKHVYDNKTTIKFGVQTKESDNMKMIMNNDFAKDYLEKY